MFRACFTVFKCLWAPLLIGAGLLAGGCGTPDAPAKGDDAGSADVATAVDSEASGDAVASSDATASDAIVGCKSASDCTGSSNPCLQPVCDPAFGCKLDVRGDGTKCDDGDKCTAGEACNNGTCTAASGTACDDANGCTKDACDPSTGDCVHNAKLDGAKCDDGDVCNGSTDACTAGKCAGGPNQCQCDKDGDCKQFEDGNPCNGTLKCAVKDAVGVCKIDVKTVVSCSTKEDTTCMTAQCEPTTGKCGIKPAKGLITCNDGNACTQNDQCKIGVCKGTYFCECEKDADCANKDDANACNGTLHCAVGNTCKVDPTTIVKCTGQTTSACTVMACSPATGKCGGKPALDGNPCDDGEPCWEKDTCKGGKCSPGPVKACGCINNSDCPDDGNKCNGVPTCNPKTHKCAVDPASAVSCTESDGNSCTVAGCDPANGSCVEKPANAGKSCDDGDACTGAEKCKNGACGLGKPVTDCDDKDACTTDACNPKTAKCEHTKVVGCGPGVIVPTEPVAMFKFLTSAQYKSVFTGESKVHTGSIHAPVRAWFSPPLFKSLTAGNKEHPIGSATVKELFNADQKTLKGWAVNVKVDDDGQSTDWYSYEVFSTTSGANPVANGKGVPLCVSCHKSGKDFILSKFPLL